MLENKIKIRLSDHQTKKLFRHRTAIHSRNKNIITIENKKLFNFCSNDYLGIACDPEVKKAFIKGVQKYGVGSSGASVVSGYYTPHQCLEEKFAEFLGREKAILFNSGYHANIGVITALANRHSMIISDKYCHASLLEGIVLSRAKHIRYQHNNISNLENIFKENTKNNYFTFIVTESVFSMTGEISPLDKIAQMSKHYRSHLIIDDAHGIGILGRQGKGSGEYFDLSQDDIICLITPLGKALGGIGAIVSGEKTLINLLLQFSKSYLYTTALPPALAFGTLKALEIIQKENWRRAKLQHNIHYFNTQVKLRELTLISTELIPIKSLIIRDIQSALMIKEKLQERGFLVACIRPPSVPKNATCLRISLNCFHEEKDMHTLLDIIAEHYPGGS